jgi:hypothetical protein
MHRKIRQNKYHQIFLSRMVQGRTVVDLAKDPSA